MNINKRFQVKVLDSSGTFIKNFSPEIIANDPNFSSEINSGFGENTFILKLPFDDFDEGSSIDYENFVEIYEFDTNNPTARLIYKGVVTGYEPVAELGNQYVRLISLGLISFLTRDYFKDGSSFTVDYGVSTGSSTDPKNMIEDIIDQVLTIYPNCGLYYSSSIATLGTNIEKKFESKTWLQALKEAFALYGDGYYWRIEKDGLVTVATNPGSATHTFTFNKHIDQANAEKTTEDLVNSVRVSYTGGTYDHSDATSITNYGKRHKNISATEIDNATAAQNYAEQYVGSRKDPKVAAKIVINSVYDIESIKVGDTCKVLGLKDGQNPFGTNMQIQRLRYRADTVELSVESIRRNFGDQIEKFTQT